MRYPLPGRRIELLAKKLDGEIIRQSTSQFSQTASIRYKEYSIGIICYKGMGCQADIFVKDTTGSKLVAECKGACYVLTHYKKVVDDVKHIAYTMNEAGIPNEFCKKWRVEVI